MKMSLAPEVFFHGQRFIETLRLEDHTDVAAYRGRLPHYVVAAHKGVPA